MGGPPLLPVEASGAYPPVPELFCPSCLLGGHTLEELGPVTAATATRSRSRHAAP